MLIARVVRLSERPGLFLGYMVRTDRDGYVQRHTASIHACGARSALLRRECIGEHSALAHQPKVMDEACCWRRFLLAAAAVAELGELSAAGGGLLGGSPLPSGTSEGSPYKAIAL